MSENACTINPFGYEDTSCDRLHDPLNWQKNTGPKPDGATQLSSMSVCGLMVPYAVFSDESPWIGLSPNDTLSSEVVTIDPTLTDLKAQQQSPQLYNTCSLKAMEREDAFQTPSRSDSMVSLCKCCSSLTLESQGYCSWCLVLISEHKSRRTWYMN